MTVLDWRTAWAAVVVHPLFSVALTLIAFQLALMLYRRSGWLVLQPVMVGMLLVVGTLTLVDLDYARYRDGAALVAMLLGLPPWRWRCRCIDISSVSSSCSGRSSSPWRSAACSAWF